MRRPRFTSAMRIAGATAIVVGATGLLAGRSDAQSGETPLPVPEVPVPGAGATTTTTIRPSGPATSSNFRLAAEAESIQVTVASPYLPAVQSISASPWGASASLNSLGQSMADAGAPYSPVVASLPGTVNGLGAGQLPPLPPIPGYVSASYPTTPSKSQTQVGYQITADAGEHESVGEVNVGIEQPGSERANIFASARASAGDDGSFGVKASAGAILLDLGGIAQIGDVSTTLEMTVKPGEPPVFTGTTNLGTISLLGLPTGLSGSGAALLGLDVPLPISELVIGLLEPILAPNGIHLRYLPQRFVYSDGSESEGQAPEEGKTLQSVESGALELRASFTPPAGEPVDVQLVVGRVYLSVTSGSGSGRPPSTTPTTSGGPAPTTARPSSSPPVTSSRPNVTTAPRSSSSAGAPVASPSAQQPVADIVPGGPFGPSGESFYLMLVLAGLGAVVGSQLIRFLSVRLVLSHPGGHP